MNYRCPGRAIAAVILVGGSTVPALAQSDRGEIAAYAATTPIRGLPTGPYSGWTPEDRQKALTRISGFCQYLCVDAYNGQNFPSEAAAERAKYEVKVCLGACIIGHVPADFPQMAAQTQQLRADFEKAKELGSSAPWPLPAK